MTINDLIIKCATPIDTVIIEFDNGTNKEFDMWNMNISECHKLIEHRYKKIDAYDMYDTDQGKVLQVWL